MLCENIAHGINLRKSPCMQYLYYMKQVCSLHMDMASCAYTEQSRDILFANSNNVKLVTSIYA